MSLYRQLRPGPGRKREEVQANQRARVIAATIECVADRGYERTTVGSIVRLAGVSKASFYEQFSGKDECVVAACDTALRAAARAVLRGEKGGGDPRERLQAGLTALADLIAAQPKAAKLVLVDGLASTPEVRAHVCRRFGLFAALARERLTATGRHKLPNALSIGIARGIEHHVRRCVAAGCPERFRDLVDPLLDWGLAFNCEEAAAAFAASATPARAGLPDASGRTQTAGRRLPQTTRDLLFAATLRLAAQEGFRELSPTRIRRAAGVSRGSFDANFDTATSCFLAAVGNELTARFDGAVRTARSEAADWSEVTGLALSDFAARLAETPDLARLAFVETQEAAPASLEWRQKLIAGFAEALYRDAPAASRPSPPAAEATIAAIWGLIGDLAEGHRLHLLAAQTPRLVLFALTPGTESRQSG